MLGDILIAIKTFWEQQITCRHEYQVHLRKDYPPLDSYEVCNKCGRCK